MFWVSSYTVMFELMKELNSFNSTAFLKRLSKLSKEDFIIWFFSWILTISLWYFPSTLFFSNYFEIMLLSPKLSSFFVNLLTEGSSWIFLNFLFFIILPMFFYIYSFFSKTAWRFSKGSSKFFPVIKAEFELNRSSSMVERTFEKIPVF